MSAIICVIAAPVAALTIWGLLRSPVAARFVAAPSGDRWRVRATPTLGGVGIFAGFALARPAGRRGASRGRQLRAPRHPRRRRDRLRSRAARRPALAARPGQAGRAGRRRRGRARGRSPRRDRLQRRPRGSPGRALARRDDERVQPARQHGRPRRLARRRRRDVLRDRRRLPAQGEPAARALAVDRVRRARLPALQLPPAQAGGGVHGRLGQPGARVRARRARAWRRAGRWPSRPSRRCSCRCSILAVPILDTALVTTVRVVEGRPITQGGRDHTSHRLVRGGLGEKSTVVLLAAVAAGLGASSLAYSAIGNPRITLVGVLVTLRPARPVRRLPHRPRSRRPGCDGRDGAAAQDPPEPTPPDRGAGRLRADQRGVRRSPTSCSRPATGRPTRSTSSSSRCP